MKSLNIIAKSILVALPLIILAGCATSPVSNSEALSIPSERVLSSQLTKEGPGTVRLTVKRDTGMMGAACAHKLYLDGTHVALIRLGEKITLHVQPGNHVIGAAPSGICGGGTAENEANMKFGEPKTFRISSGQDGTIKISATAF